MVTVRAQRWQVMVVALETGVEMSLKTCRLAASGVRKLSELDMLASRRTLYTLLLTNCK